MEFAPGVSDPRLEWPGHAPYRPPLAGAPWRVLRTGGYARVAQRVLGMYLAHFLLPLFPEGLVTGAVLEPCRVRGLRRGDHPST